MATSKATRPPAVVPSSAGRPGRRARRWSSAAGGGSGAFEEVYRAHAGRLYSVACRMLGNPADAEDLLQEIFLSAHRKLDSFRGESALGTWLYRLATNLCLDHLRSRAARTSQLTDALDDEPALADAGSRGSRSGRSRRWISSARWRSCPKGAGGVRAARRRRPRAPRGRRGARHRRRHVEVAGAQGAAAAARARCPDAGR